MSNMKKQNMSKADIILAHDLILMNLDVWDPEDIANAIREGFVTLEEVKTRLAADSIWD
jgi:hypothetical protein